MSSSIAIELPPSPTIPGLPADVSPTPFPASGGAADSQPVIPVRPTVTLPVWRIWLSWMAAAVLLVLFSPVMLVCYLLVRLTSPGPGFYRQTRLGLHGEPFKVIKLRTMYIDAETRSGPVWAKKNDPRITPLGRFLRASHLDELPQLFNVIRAEMAFVGPRPERPEIAAKLVKDIPDYMDRLQVRPGITGIAQINLPPDTDLDSVRRKLALDLDYIERSSLRHDLCIMLATAPHAIGLKGKVVNRLFGCHRHFVTPQECERSLINGRSLAKTHFSNSARVQECFDEAMESLTAADRSVKRLFSIVAQEEGQESAARPVLDLARCMRETQLQQETMLLRAIFWAGLAAPDEQAESRRD